MDKVEMELHSCGNDEQCPEYARIELTEKPCYEFIKRVIDIVGALCGLILLAPLFLITAAAIYCEDAEAPIFSQIRIGRNGRPFRLYKFRSMNADAEERKQELQKMNEADGPVFKIENDPRITKIGAFIRRTSIDELPQLWNILAGSMSIVGPRPPLPEEVSQYNDYQRQRLLVKPGLTCYWQCSGRSNLAFDEWMKLDLKYICERGLWTDIKIMFMTVPAVLKGDGAC